MGLITINIQKKENNPPNATGWVVLNSQSGEVVNITYDNLTIDTNPQYSDPEGDNLESIKIKNIPTIGVLKINGVNANVGDIVTKIQLDNLELTYNSISTDYNYLDNDFEFLVSDSGSGLYYNTPGNVIFSVKGSKNKPPSNIGDGESNINTGESVVLTLDMLTTQLNLPYLDPESNPAYKLRIDKTPSSGELQLNSVKVLEGQEIWFYNSSNQVDNINNDPNIQDRDLIYVNKDYGAGLDGFSFSISDSGSKEFRR